MTLWGHLANWPNAIVVLLRQPLSALHVPVSYDDKYRLFDSVNYSRHETMIFRGTCNHTKDIEAGVSLQFPLNSVIETKMAHLSSPSLVHGST